MDGGDVYTVYIITCDVVHVQPRFNFSDNNLEFLMTHGLKGRLYLTLLCCHHSDSCVKVGNGGSHFNVSLIVRDKVTRKCPQTTTFEEKGEPKWNRNEGLNSACLTPCR